MTLKELKLTHLFAALAVMICIVFAPTHSAQSAAVNYTYDELDRLILVVYPDGTKIRYSYDEVGNMLSKGMAGALGITTTSLPSGFVGSPYNQTLNVTGGSAPFTWSIPGGRLPPGLSLDAATGAISGTPTADGTYNFDVQVLDANNENVTKFYSIVIAKHLAIATTSVTFSSTAGANSQTLVAIGGLAPYTWTITSGSLPAGLTLDTSTGVISGTPATNDVSSITVQLRDSMGTTVSGTVAVVIADYVETFASTTLPVGWSPEGSAPIVGYTSHSAPYSLLLGDAAMMDGRVSFVAPISGNLSFWYSKSSAWGYYRNSEEWEQLGANAGSIMVWINGALAFSATQDTGWVKTPSLSVQAGDKVTIIQTGNSDDWGAYCDQLGRNCQPQEDPYSHAFVNIDDVIIFAVTGPLGITTASLSSGLVGTPYTQTLAATGGLTPYTWSTTAGILPPGLSLNATTGAISGTPTADGTYNFAVQVLAANYQNVTKYYSIVIAKHLAIATTSVTFSTASANNQVLVAIGGLAPYTWSITGGSLPAGLALNSSTGVISGTPTTVGTSSFTVQVRDSMGTVASGPVTVAVADYVETFASTTLPVGWSPEGAAPIVGYTSHSTPYSLMLGDAAMMDGRVSFVAPISGNLSFWYSKSSAWGYYRNSEEWVQSGTNAGFVVVFVNGRYVFSTSQDTGWAKTPTFSVQAGDTVMIVQNGNRDDQGAYCNQQIGHYCHAQEDPYTHMSVYIDDVTIVAVPVTTATPGGGTYSSAQTVTLSTNIPATIYYTTDGTVPTTSSPVYSAPLSISATTTLSYFANGIADNRETVKSQVYNIIEANYSEPFAALVPTGWSTQGAVGIYNGASHSAPYSLAVGNGSSTDGSVSFTAPLSGGISLWYYKTSAWGYYLNEGDDWSSYGDNVGSMTISINGSVVHTVTSDTNAWVKSPVFNVHAGDTITVTQTGNSDDGGGYCVDLSDWGGSCVEGDDPYYNVTVFVDDISITGGS